MKYCWAKSLLCPIYWQIGPKLPTRKNCNNYKHDQNNKTKINFMTDMTNMTNMTNIINQKTTKHFLRTMYLLHKTHIPQIKIWGVKLPHKSLSRTKIISSYIICVFCLVLCGTTSVTSAGRGDLAPFIRDHNQWVRLIHTGPMETMNGKVAHPTAMDGSRCRSHITGTT